jgi:urease accessory protein
MTVILSPASDMGISPRLQRGDGAAELVFVNDNGRTRLKHLFQKTPCRVLFPWTDPGEPTQAVLLTTSGGLTGGDTVRLSVRAEQGTHAVVATQATEKIYRSSSGDVVISAQVEAVDGALLEWLPQETILFDRARLRRRTEVDVAEGGRLLACEMVVFGRAAHGEVMRQGFLFDRWRIRVGGRLAWTDATRIEGNWPGTLNGMGFGGADATALSVFVGSGAGRLLGGARTLVETALCRAGVTVVNGVLLGRFFGRAAEVRRALADYLRGLRGLLGLRPELPRVWST